MANLPAVCSRCGRIFPSGFSFSGGVTVVSFGSTSGPCPNCGGYGNVPDGVYNIVQNIIEVLSDPQRTIDELNRLSETLNSASEGKYSNEELKNTIEENVPEMSAVMDLLPKTREERRADIKFIITTIIAVIGIINGMTNSDKTGNIQNDIQPDQVINQVYNIESQHNNIMIEQRGNPENDSKSIPIRVNKVGRNEPCPCGSGLKYKRCHGR